MNQKEAFRETLALCEERWPSPMFGETSIEHMRDMLRRIEANSDATAPNGFSEAKLGRWLGYLQGVAVGLDVMSLEDCKDINKKWAGDSPAAPSLQSRVAEWGVAAFGEQMAVETSLSVKAERNHRFLEEALELVQAAGCSKAEALQLVDYVFARPVGELEQEVGGVMMCIALLCHMNDVDMATAAEKELTRIWGKIDAIRAKRAAKPEFSPLPGFASFAASTEVSVND